MIQISDSLILLVVLRLINQQNSFPTIEETRNGTHELLQGELNEILFDELLQSLLTRHHLELIDNQIHVRMALRFYYTEILKPGDDSLETLDFIERRTKQIEQRHESISDS